MKFKATRWVSALVIGIVGLFSLDAAAQIGTNKLRNTTGSTVSQYAIMFVDSTANLAIKEVTTSRAGGFTGVVYDTSILNNAYGNIVLPGNVTKVQVTGTVTRGDYLVSSTTLGKAASGGTTDTTGAFGVALETGTNTNIYAILVAPSTFSSSSSIAIASASMNTITLTSGTTGSLWADAATVNIGTVATTLTLGAATTTGSQGSTTGTWTIRNPAVLGSQTTQALWNTVATTINLGGAATTFNVGAGASSTATLSFTTKINLNSTAIDSNQSTVALYATPTTINEGAAATTINIGASASTTTFGGATGASVVRVNGANNTNKGYSLLTAGLKRWFIYLGGNESGSNAGADLFISTYDDSGNFLDTPWQMQRVAGGIISYFRTVAITGALSTTGTISANASGGITTNQTTFPLVNATATTINFGGAADINMSTAAKTVAITGALTVAKNVTLGSASTDAITHTGRAIFRSVTDAGPMTATNGSTAEVVFNTSNSKFYGCTAGGTPGTWSALN